MIRVLLVPSSDYLGHPFPQRHNQIFERLHDSKNFEVHVARFRLFDDSKAGSKLVVHELDDRKAGRVAPYYLLNSLSHALQIRKIVRNEGIDVVVLSNLAAPFAYVAFEHLSTSRTPVVFDLPDYYPTSAAGYLFDINGVVGRTVTGAFGSMLRYMMRRSSMVTVASEALADYARLSGVEAVVCVPNGVGECFLSVCDGGALRERLGFQRSDLVVGYIGSMEFWLEMEPLIKSIALARQRGLAAKLLLVGSRLHTDFSVRVEQLIERENIQDYVKWLDFVPYEQVPMYMAGLDVGVIPFDVLNPTAYYAAPNKLWEYLSQMKPVIATPIPEVMKNADCVLRASTEEDYARQMLAVADNDPEVSRKTEIGYKRALNMTWDNSARAFGLAIRSLLRQD